MDNNFLNDSDRSVISSLPVTVILMFFLPIASEFVSAVKRRIGLVIKCTSTKPTKIAITMITKASNIILSRNWVISFMTFDCLAINIIAIKRDLSIAESGILLNR